MAVAAAWENLQVLKLSAERRAELSWDERDERDANRIIYTIHTRGTRPPACARCTLRVYTLDTARHDNIFWKRYIYVEIRLLSSACWLYNKRRLLFFFLSSTSPLFSSLSFVLWIISISSSSASPPPPFWTRGRHARNRSVIFLSRTPLLSIPTTGDFLGTCHQYLFDGSSSGSSSSGGGCSSRVFLHVKTER